MEGLINNKFAPILCVVLVVSLSIASLLAIQMNSQSSIGQEQEQAVIMETGIFPFYEEEELMARAALVVYGRVVRESDPFWIECYFGSKALHTDFYVEPYEILRGETFLDEVVVRTRGGETDDLILIVRESPNFQIGEKYLLFLTAPSGGPFATPGEYYYIIGGLQGVFEVEEASSGLFSRFFGDSDDEVSFEQVSGSFELTLTELQEELEEINATVPIPDEISIRQEGIDALISNMRNDVILWDFEFLEEVRNMPLRPARIIPIE